MDDPVRIFYVCERCGSAVPPFPTGYDRDLDAIDEHLKSGCEDDRCERIAKALHVAHISCSTGTRGVEDVDGRAVLTPLGAGPSLRPWRREPVPRDFCRHCSSGNGAVPLLSSRLRGTTHQAQHPPSSSTTDDAQTSSSSDTTTMANGIDYEDEALRPRPQLADRLCVATTTLQESPLGVEGGAPGVTPLLTLTPTVQQDSNCQGF